MKLNLIGNSFGASGFANHINQLAKALHNQGVEVRIDCPKPQGWELTVKDHELLMLTREFEQDMVSVLIGQPHFMPLVWSENPTSAIPFVIWEGDRIPHFWCKYLLDERIKQIWCPSEHVKKAILFYPENKYLNNKIKIVPHGVNLNIFQPLEKKEEKRPFIFCSNKGFSQGINDRGGMQFLVKAYVEEFTNKDNVLLKLKINPSYLNGEFNVVKEFENIGVIKKSNSPKLMISTANIDYKQMPMVYDGDVFISPTMAEAFNIPPAESMAMGLPCIVTKFGGQVDFVNNKNGWLVKGKLVEVTWDKMYENVRWMRPDVKELRKIMRWCYEHPAEVKKKGQEALKSSVKMTWNNSAKLVLENLKKIS